LSNRPKNICVCKSLHLYDEVLRFERADVEKKKEENGKWLVAIDVF